MFHLAPRLVAARWTLGVCRRSGGSKLGGSMSNETIAPGLNKCIATTNKCIATSNKCIATSNKCLTSSNKKLETIWSF